MQLITTSGAVSLFRNETFNCRTTPTVEWVVRLNDKTIRECSTKKEALLWVSIFTDCLAGLNSTTDEA